MGQWDGRQSVGAEEGQMGREQHQTVTSEGALEAALQAASHSALGLANHRGQYSCLLYTSPSPRDKRQSRMPSSA